MRVYLTCSNPNLPDYKRKYHFKNIADYIKCDLDGFNELISDLKGHSVKLTDLQVEACSKCVDAYADDGKFNTDEYEGELVFRLRGVPQDVDRIYGYITDILLMLVD